jgi:hypothetical protein
MVSTLRTIVVSLVLQGCVSQPIDLAAITEIIEVTSPCVTSLASYVDNQDHLFDATKNYGFDAFRDFNEQVTKSLMDNLVSDDVKGFCGPSGGRHNIITGAIKVDVCDFTSVYGQAHVAVHEQAHEDKWLHPAGANKAYQEHGVHVIQPYAEAGYPIYNLHAWYVFMIDLYKQKEKILSLEDLQYEPSFDDNASCEEIENILSFDAFVAYMSEQYSEDDRSVFFGITSNEFSISFESNGCGILDALYPLWVESYLSSDFIPSYDVLDQCGINEQRLLETQEVY